MWNPSKLYRHHWDSRFQELNCCSWGERKGAYFREMSPFEGRMYIHFKGKAVQYSCAVIAIDHAPRAKEVTFVIQQAVKTNTCIKWYHSSAVITTYTYTLNCKRSSVLRRPIEALTLEGLSVVLHKSQRRWEGEAGLQLLGQMKTMPRILHRSGFGGGREEGDIEHFWREWSGRERVKFLWQLHHRVWY